MLGRPLGVGGQAVIVLSLVLRVLPMLMPEPVWRKWPRRLLRLWQWARVGYLQGLW